MEREGFRMNFFIIKPNVEDFTGNECLFYILKKRDIMKNGYMNKYVELKLTRQRRKKIEQLKEDLNKQYREAVIKAATNQFKRERLWTCNNSKN